jgi:DNA-directed RNA polymerase subunit omega
MALDRGAGGFCSGLFLIFPSTTITMRDDYLKEAKAVIKDPNVLINVVSRRVKQLKRGSRPLVESLEKLSLEDVALREVIEGKITFELAGK